jgi:polyhydroxyalkanoate synthesis regulator phasin
MEEIVRHDLITPFKQLEFNQLQSVLKNYKQTLAQPSVETDTEALAEAIRDLEAQLQELEAELKSLSA